MKQNIACPCGKKFTAEPPDEVDLDASPAEIDRITSGAFMSFICPACGKVHKPEFPVMFRWPSKKLVIEFLGELDRGEFYRRKKDPPAAETVIGYAELADRIAVVRDGLEPAAVEAIKYFLLLKAEESLSETEDFDSAEASVWYRGKVPGADSAEAGCGEAGGGAASGGLEFHLHGIKPGEVAVSRIPLGLYEKTLADYQKHPKGEVFAALRTRSYLSVQNTLRPQALK